MTAADIQAIRDALAADCPREDIDLIAVMELLAELDRLRAICTSAHDRLLRGDDDRELLALLATAWEKQ